MALDIASLAATPTDHEEAPTSRPGQWVRSLLGNAALVVAIFATFVFFMSIFAPIELTDLSLVPKVTAEALLTILLFESVSIVSTSQGAHSGLMDPIYTDAKESAGKLAALVIDGGCRGLSDYCEEYAAQEHETAVRQYLARHGIKLQAVIDWAERGKTNEPGKWSPTRTDRAIIAKAKRIRPVRINPDMLTVADGDLQRRGRAPTTATETQRKSFRNGLLTTAIFALVTVSVVPIVTAEISVAAVVLFLIKLFGVVYRFISGLRTGRNAYIVNGAAFCRWQERHLTLYLAWLKAREPVPVPASIPAPVTESQE